MISQKEFRKPFLHGHAFWLTTVPGKGVGARIMCKRNAVTGSFPAAPPSPSLCSLYRYRHLTPFSSPPPPSTSLSLDSTRTVPAARVASQARTGAVLVPHSHYSTHSLSLTHSLQSPHMPLPPLLIVPSDGAACIPLLLRGAHSLQH